MCHTFCLFYYPDSALRRKGIGFAVERRCLCGVKPMPFQWQAETLCTACFFDDIIKFMTIMLID